MTDRIVLNWEVDGFIEEQRYYCSETAIDPLNLPTPKVVFANDVRTYTDTDVLVDKTYYVCISAVKNGVEKVSDIKTVKTQTLLLDMPFSVDKNDHGKYALTAITVGSAVIQDGYLYVPAGSYLTFDTSAATDLNLGTEDFELGVEVALMATGGGTYPCIFGMGTSWVSTALSMQFNSAPKFMCAIMNPDEKDVLAASNQVKDGTTFVKYVVKRVAGVWTTYNDGVAGTSVTDASFAANFTRQGQISIGAAVWSVAITSSHSKIKNLYLKKL